MRAIRRVTPCQIRVAAAWLALAVVPASAQTVTLAAVDSVGVGGAVEVRWQGGTDERDFITIVPVDTPEGRYQTYGYARDNPVKLVAPDQPGAYELRYLAAVRIQRWRDEQ